MPFFKNNFLKKFLQYREGSGSEPFEKPDQDPDPDKNRPDPQRKGEKQHTEGFDTSLMTCLSQV
jgi:hypothetical protein